MIGEPQLQPRLFLERKRIEHCAHHHQRNLLGAVGVEAPKEFDPRLVSLLSRHGPLRQSPSVRLTVAKAKLIGVPHAMRAKRHDDTLDSRHLVLDLFGVRAQSLYMDATEEDPEPLLKPLDPKIGEREVELVQSGQKLVGFVQHVL